MNFHLFILNLLASQECTWMTPNTFSSSLTFLTHSRAADDRSEVDGSMVSMVSATSSSSRLLPPKERLREKAFQYCQRLIEQCDRSECVHVNTSQSAWVIQIAQVGMTGVYWCCGLRGCLIFLLLCSFSSQRQIKRQTQTCRKLWVY